MAPRISPKQARALGTIGIAIGSAVAAQLKKRKAAAAAPADGGPGLPAGERQDSGAPHPADPRPQSADAIHPVGSTPPVETPGPSVTPPAMPESDTERAERAEATTPDPEVMGARMRDPLVDEEEAAAAAEAAAIGGPAPQDADDPAMEAVIQGGGGVAEGFELAEEDLEANATHADGGGDPIRDAPTPEVESDRATAEYAEADAEGGPDGAVGSQ